MATSDFQDKVDRVRAEVVKMVYSAKSGHIGGSLSCALPMVAIYDNFNVNSCPEGKLDHNSDIVILSKGHAAPVLYACEKVFKQTVSEQDIKDFRRIHGRLQGHPDKTRLPEAVASTGSLGQGASIACGHAIQKKRRGLSGKVFCILGDGEFQEGQVFEAMMFAAKEQLNNLVFVLDSNKYQNDGAVVYDLDYEKIAIALGLDARSVFSSDPAFDVTFLASFDSAQKTVFVVHNSFKAEGVSFMEGDPKWHGGIPNEQEYMAALSELGVSIDG